MTPLERFNAWLQGKPVNGMTYIRAVELATELSHSQDDLVRTIVEIRHWLAKNEGGRKTNKRLWGKFFLNWLKPKSSRQTGRLEPSNFGENS